MGGMEKRMDRMEMVSVGEAARIGRVTVRTLHHYDQIGLLVPSHRSKGEYRLYSRTDLERLHQIRLYRQLGMPLAEIRELLDGEGFDRGAALRAHRERLAGRIQEDQALIRTLDRMIQGDKAMRAEEMFDGFHHEEYEAEAKQRWGQGDPYRVAQERVKGYSKADKARIKVEHAALLQALADVMASGAEADSEAAMDCAEQVRLHMDCHYYPLSREAHAGLGQMYLQDPRFMKTYEDVAQGLTRFLVSAIEANWDRH